MVVQALLGGAAIVGWACAGWFYIHLYRWARECQEARIAIEFKKKVKIDAPLVEWLLWIRQVKKDKQQGGRVVYSLGGTRVAILPRVKRRHKRWNLRERTVRETRQPSQISQLSQVTNRGVK